ncbi:hypothetical protein GCM10027596_16670 [Nocardioides korecus]
MNVRRTSLTGLSAIAVAASISLLAPAAMADPKLPDGCTFDRSTGTSTCTTITTGDKTYEDVLHVVLPADDTFPGTFCSVNAPGYLRYSGEPAAVVSAQTTTTVTRTFQGAYNSRKPVSDTSTSTTTYTVEGGMVTCYSGPPIRFGPGTTAQVTTTSPSS